MADCIFRLRYIAAVTGVAAVCFCTLVAGAKAAEPIPDLEQFLQQSSNFAKVAEQPFASTPLSKEQATQAADLLWQAYSETQREALAAEFKARKLKLDKLEMPFWFKVFGEKPDGGRSLYISMHGGGGAPARINDSQWENQKRLYEPEEGVYLVPRAPTDTWNLWHQGHIDDFFDRLIQAMVVFEDVNPDRVYIMGYSAGGDGVYQLAPRMSDRLAAASMMAGHPNETSPLGLRNVPFSLHVGGNDGAYSRNRIGGEWKTKLDELQKQDPDGYEHWAKVYEGKGHWLDREDRAAIPWMAKFNRQTVPKKIVWVQDDVTHNRFYWLHVDDENKKGRATVVATLDGQTIDIDTKDIKRITVRLNDAMLDLEQPIKITAAGKTLFEGKVKRTIGELAKTLAERGDPRNVSTAEVSVDLPEPTEAKAE